MPTLEASTSKFRNTAIECFSQEDAPLLIEQLERLKERHESLFEALFAQILSLTATEEALSRTQLWQARQAIMMLYTYTLNENESLDKPTQYRLERDKERFRRFHNRQNITQRKQ